MPSADARAEYPPGGSNSKAKRPPLSEIRSYRSPVALFTNTMLACGIRPLDGSKTVPWMAGRNILRDAGQCEYKSRKQDNGMAHGSTPLTQVSPASTGDPSRITRSDQQFCDECGKNGASSRCGKFVSI